MTAQELIADAFERLKNSSPDVQKAALLRIARVQTKTEPAQARATLDAGLAIHVRLFDHGHIDYLRTYWLEDLPAAEVPPSGIQQFTTLDQ